jgi:hypothetical protein
LKTTVAPARYLVENGALEIGRTGRAPIRMVLVTGNTRPMPGRSDPASTQQNAQAVARRVPGGAAFAVFRRQTTDLKH